MAKLDGLGREVTREEGTVFAYRKRVPMLMNQASTHENRVLTLLETIAYFGSRHDEFKDSSIRSYFAALTLAVDDAVERGELDTEAEQSHRDMLSCRPRPRPKTEEPRTSAKKRKSVAVRELRDVCLFLRQRGKIEDLLLMRLLAHGTVLALRPSEYSDASVQGDLLIVRNRKTTNGRGLGEFRELDLEDTSDDEKASIDRLILDFGTASAGELGHLIDRLGGRLRRACMRLGIKPIALYTTRHQAIANLKAAGKNAAEIAAVVGHRSLHTAGKSYAPRSKGWKNAAIAHATPETVAKLAAVSRADDALKPQL